MIWSWPAWISLMYSPVTSPVQQIFSAVWSSGKPSPAHQQIDSGFIYKQFWVKVISLIYLTFSQFLKRCKKRKVCNQLWPSSLPQGKNNISWPLSMSCQIFFRLIWQHFTRTNHSVDGIGVRLSELLSAFLACTPLNSWEWAQFSSFGAYHLYAEQGTCRLILED